MKRVLGVDPGVTNGALVFGSEVKGKIDWTWWSEIPVLKGKSSRIDQPALVKLLKEVMPVVDEAWIEVIRSFGAVDVKMGETQKATFFREAGVLEGLLTGLDFNVHRVETRSWKSFSKVHMRIDLDKTVSCVRFIELFPQYAPMLIPPGCRTYSDGRADAALIARYGLLKGSK